MSHCRNVFVKQEIRSMFVCFVCGSASAEPFPLHSKPRDRGSFFPFLEHHHVPSGAVPPGPDSVVSSCFLCYSFLNTQWEAYEKSCTPHTKRLYWLKRTDNGPFAGMDTGMQLEFASQYLGMLPTNLDSGQQIQNEPVAEAVNHSMQFKQEAPETQEASKPKLLFNKEPATEDNSVLDLSIPSKPAQTPLNALCLPVCYVCGEECSKDYMTVVSAKPLPNAPYFPSLLSHPKPVRAKCMDEVGQVEVCDRCHVVLMNHWDSLQKSSSVPNSDRNFSLTTQMNSETNMSAAASSSSSQPSSQFVCYACGLQYPKSYRRDVQVSGESDSPFRFLEKYPRAPGAKPISGSGKLYLCSVCYKAFSRQMRVYQIEDTPEDQRVYKVPSEIAPSESTVLRDRLMNKASNERHVSRSCFLCSKLSSSLKYVESLPQSSKMYFPFLHELCRSSGQTDAMDAQGRFLVCSSCYGCLHAQWESFQSAQVPPSQRHYSTQQAKSEVKGRNLLHHSSTMPIQVSVPEEPIINHSVLGSHEPLLTTVTSVVYGSTSRASDPVRSGSTPHASKDSVEAVEPSNTPTQRIFNPLEMPTGKPAPLMIATTCFICAEYTTPGNTFSISSSPPQNGLRCADEFQTSSIPFFPFLTKLSASNQGSPERVSLAEDGSSLVCTFCYHSLMAQWLAYETSPHPEDSNCWQRRYNTHHYVCYICGITTYRKRVRSITVRDFPFLVEHPRPPGALTLQGGESVVTCLTCFESLMSQWKDFERMKLPVEMRKYNWIVMPPPPENESESHALQNAECPPSRDPMTSALSLCTTGGGQHEDLQRHDFQVGSSGVPHGSKPPPLTMQPGCHPGKPRNSMTAVSPLYQPVVPPPHPATSGLVYSANGSPAFAHSSRTSSFAAALRKLAKQAVDPITIEKELSPVTPVSSPALCQRSSPPKRSVTVGGPGSVYLNSQPASVPSPPVSAAPPHWTSDPRKPLDLGPRTHASNGHSAGRLAEPLSLKLEAVKGNGHNKREAHLTTNPKDILQSRSVSVSSSSSVAARPEEGSPSCAPTSSGNSRGFQPYRVLDESRGHQLSSLPPPPPPHYDSSSLAPYSYHPATFLPSHHLPHPPYRFEEPMYLEACGVLRPSVMHLPSPSGLLAPHPSVPSFFSSPGAPTGPGGVPISRFPRRDVLNSTLGFGSPSMHQDRELKEVHHDSKHEMSRRDHDRLRDQERIHRDQERREHQERWEQERRDQHNSHQQQQQQQGEVGHGAEVHPHENDIHMNPRDPSPHAAGLARNTAEPPSHMQLLPRQLPQSSVSPPLGPLNLAMGPPGSQHHSPLGPSSESSHAELQRQRCQEVELWVARQQAVTAAANAEGHPPPIPDDTLYKHSYNMQQERVQLMQQRHHTVENDKTKEPFKDKYMGLELMSKYPPGGPAPEGLTYSHHQPQHHLHQTATFQQPSQQQQQQQQQHQQHQQQQQLSQSGHLLGGGSHSLLNGSLLRPEDKVRAPFLLPNERNKVPPHPHLDRLPHKLVPTPAFEPSLHEGMHTRLLETEKPYSEWRDNRHTTSADDKVLPQAPVKVQRPMENVCTDKGQTGNHPQSGREMPMMPYASRLVSRLDQEEDRLRAARMKGGSCPPSDEEDEEEDAETLSNGLHSQVIITKGPPMKMDPNPKKLDFLRSFGLVTQRKRKELELKKFLKRMKILGQRDYPLELENEENFCLKSKGLTFLLMSLKKPSIAPQGDESTDEKQVDFLSRLGLNSAPVDNREEGEQVWRAVVEDRARRQGILLPLREIQDSNLPPPLQQQQQQQQHSLSLGRGLKRKLSDEHLGYPNGVVGLSEKVTLSLPVSCLLPPQVPSSSQTSKPLGGSTHPTSATPVLDSAPSDSKKLLQNGIVHHPGSSHPGHQPHQPVPPAPQGSREHGEGALAGNLSVQQTSGSNHQTPELEPESQSRQPGSMASREFAQEFHQLVLQTTKQQRIEQSQCKQSLLSGSGSGSTSNNHIESNNKNAAGGMPATVRSRLLPPHWNQDKEESCSDTPGFKWPGLEAVLEAYDRYRTEQNLETEVLQERWQHLLQQNQELEATAEAHRQRMNELFQTKRQLDQERQAHQQALDNLKQCLRQLRS